MPTQDTAQLLKDALVAAWPSIPCPVAATPTLHVDDDYQPKSDTAQLLVANDGGPAIANAWMLRPTPDRRVTPRAIPRRLTLRLTAFAKSRRDAREVVDAAADWFVDNPTSAGVALIEDVSDPLITRDRATGAYLASVTMPVIVRPV